MKGPLNEAIDRCANVSGASGIVGTEGMFYMSVHL